MDYIPRRLRRKFRNPQLGYNDTERQNLVDSIISNSIEDDYVRTQGRAIANKRIRQFQAKEGRMPKEFEIESIANDIYTQLRAELEKKMKEQKIEERKKQILRREVQRIKQLIKENERKAKLEQQRKIREEKNIEKDAEEYNPKESNDEGDFLDNTGKGEEVEEIEDLEN